MARDFDLARLITDDGLTITTDVVFDTNTLYVDSDNNRVGVVTLTPSYSLDVNGSLNSTSLYIGGTQVTSTATELNYVDGVTSNIQTQLDAKLALAGGTMTGDILYNDSVKAKFGTGSDLQIYHDGSNSFIVDDGTGNLYIKSVNLRIQDTASESFIETTQNGAVDLYYNNVKKFNTDTAGVTVTGNITVSGTVDGRDVATDGTKLDGIESGATADQTASEILTLIKTVDGTGSGLDADTLDALNSTQFLRSDTTDVATILHIGGPMVASQAKLQVYGFQRTGPIMVANGLTGDTSWNTTNEAWITNDNGTLKITDDGSSHGDTIWHAGNDGASSGLDADLLDGQHGSYYLDWGNVTNKPDPTITLAGDLSGVVTLTDVGSATLTATIVANAVELGTDTTGDYVESLVAGTGVSLSNNSGESATPTIAIGQSVGTSDNVTFNNVTVSGTLTSDDITSANISVAGNATITGNLTVSGTTTTVNSNTVAIGDSIITLNSDETGTPSQDGGIEIERGTSTNVSWVWDETNDRWTSGAEAIYTTGAISGASLTTTGNITVGGTVDGRDVATDGSKLDGIESGATADQTASEILTLIKTVDGAGSGLDADTLDGVQGSSFLRSDADDTATGQITFPGAIGSRPILPNGFIGMATGDADVDIWGISEQYYPSHATSANAWGIKWSATPNQVQFVGDGTNRLVVDLDGGSTGLTWEGNSVWHAGNDGSGSGLDADLLDGQQGSYYLNTSTTFGGDVSGTYNAIVVANDSHTHTFDNLTSKTSGTGDYTTTGTFRAQNFRVVNAYYLGENNYYLNNTNSGWYSNVKIQSGADMRAPVFYDSNDTNYYVDPDGTSLIDKLGVQSSSTATPINLSESLTYYAFRILNRDSGSWLSFAGNSAYTTIQAQSSTTVAEDISLNPFGGNVGVGTTSPGQLLGVAPDTDVSAEIGRAHIGSVGHTDYAAFSHVDQNSTSGYALLQSSGGTTYLNALNGQSIRFRINNADYGIFNTDYLSHTSDMRAPIFYDLDNTAYYINPNGSSVITDLYFQDSNTRMYEGSNNAVRIQTDSGYIDIGPANTSYAHFYTDISQFYFNRQIVIGGGLFPYTTNSYDVGSSGLAWRDAYFGTSVRAPIFYDSDNTGYYVNPASTSVFNNIDTHSLDITALSGRGIRFWNTDNYKIYMSYSGDATWGGRLDSTSDYNIYFKMMDGTNRGFVFMDDTTPVFQIESTGQVRTASGNIYANGNLVWHAGNDGSGSGLDADTLDGVQGSSFLRSDTSDTQTSGSIAFGTATLDPDSFASYSGGFGNIADGSGWGARGLFIHGGATGDAAAIGHNGGALYFGIQNNSAGNSMATWLDVAPSTKVANFAATPTVSGSSVWHAGNDGSGSGLDADLLDGYHASTTRNAANTIPIRDANGYLQLGWINTTSGATTNTIDKIYATYSGDNYIRYVTPATLISQLALLRTNQSDQTIDGGTNTTLRIRAQDSGLALLQLGYSTNGTQATGAVEVTQDSQHGGGMSYNGDGSPSFVSSESADYITFYRMNAGTRSEVFAYPYNSDTVYFNGTGQSAIDFRAPIFYDTNNTGYYVDPASITNVNRIYAGYSHGSDNSVGCSNWFRSSGNTGWYNGSYGGGIYMSDSTWVRVYNNKQFWAAGIIQSDTDVRAPIFYDTNDTGYYVNPNGNTVLSTLNLYAELNFPNAGAKYIDHNGDLYFRYSDNSSFYNSRFTIYGNSGDYVQASGSVRGQIWYDSNDTSVYFDQNALVLRGSSPTVYFRDTDHNSGMIHNNSNLHYVLRGGNDTTGWSQVNGQWPHIVNLSNNDCTVGGNFYAVGNVTAYSSDVRLKENIVEIPNAIEKIKKIRGVTFDWKDIVDEIGFTPDTKFNDLGVIAQEVQAVIPQAVIPAPFDAWVADPKIKYSKEELAEKTGTSRSGENYLTVNLEKIVPLLIEGIKEQQNEIDELKALVKELINNK